MIDEKKKIKTIYGTIEVNKKALLGQMSHSFSISPYLQEKMLYIGQKEVFSQGSETFENLLQLKVCSSQIQRICLYYGTLSETEEIIKTAHPSQETDVDSVLYAQVDGSNIPTEKGWKEVKLGRIFSEGDLKTKVSVYQGVAGRTSIEKSDYLACKGNNLEFINDFEVLLNDRLSQNHKEVVFITDGETWIDNWLEENYNQYPRILDYYHAVKPLKDFANKAISDEKRKEWLNQQMIFLLSTQTELLLSEVDKIENLSNLAQTAKEDLKRYYKNNEHRMDYASYKLKGWAIGSGAIESAHRVVIQKRMKLCGQRWGKNAQPMLNLRAINKSKKWSKIVQLVNLKSFEKAA